MKLFSALFMLMVLVIYLVVFVAYLIPYCVWRAVTQRVRLHEIMRKEMAPWQR